MIIHIRDIHNENLPKKEKALESWQSNPMSRGYLLDFGTWLKEAIDNFL